MLLIPMNMYCIKYYILRDVFHRKIETVDTVPTFLGEKINSS